MAGRAHVLIVDDDPIVGQTFGRMLTVSGFDATVTHSAQSAIEAAGARLPDVILTDRECRARERANLMKALQRTDGRIYGAGGAAELLGINPTTLASRLRALKITPPRPR